MSQTTAETHAIDEAHVSQIAAELRISPDQVRATAELLADGATVPFIARYRKEATGSLDEVAITSIRDRLAQLAELRDRRLAIIKSLAERNCSQRSWKRRYSRLRRWPNSRTYISHTGRSGERGRPSPGRRDSSRSPT